MKKEISHKEKLEFYKKYNSEEFIKELKRDEDKYNKIGFNGLMILLLISVIGTFFCLWFAMLMLPCIDFPFCTMAVSFKSYKKKVDNLTPNITYKDFMKMYKNGEWQQLAKEVDNNLQVNEKPKYFKSSFLNEIKKFGIAKVSKLSGVARTTLTKWCSGEIVPTFVNAQKVANAMGLEFLLFDKE